MNMNKKEFEFGMELRALLNRHSKENRSDTPDFILSEYLGQCLDAFDQAVVARTAWNSLNGSVPPRSSADWEGADAKLPKELSASEALYGFVGWLSSRKEATVIGAAYDSLAKLDELVEMFCDANGLSDPGYEWNVVIKHPDPAERAVDNISDTLKAINEAYPSAENAATALKRVASVGINRVDQHTGEADRKAARKRLEEALERSWNDPNNAALKEAAIVSATRLLDSGYTWLYDRPRHFDSIYDEAFDNEHE